MMRKFERFIPPATPRQAQMSNEDSHELSRQHLIEQFARQPFPHTYERLLSQLDFSEFEQALAKSVYQIETKTRPPEIRAFEFLLAAFHSLRSLLFGTKPRNYTVGSFQIGIETSLHWTRTPVTAVNFIRRIAFLASPMGSLRLFRIALRRSGMTRRRWTGDDKELAVFARFYNGKGSTRSTTLRYEGLLSVLLQRNSPKSQGQHLAETATALLESGITARLKKIREAVVQGDELAAAVVLCSLSQRRAIYSKYYGDSEKNPPAINSPRAVGSTIKVALYSAFLERHRVGKDFQLSDSPVEISWRGEKLTPRNADRRFRGLVTLEYAFANSINVPAIKITQLLGTREFVSFLRKCGIHGPLPNSPLLGLGAIKLTAGELLSTLSPILSGGYLSWPQGATAQQPAPLNDGERLLSNETAGIMSDLLKATAIIGTAKFLGGHDKNALGGKTGTSEGSRDFWFMGPVNKDVYGLVWLGFRDERPIRSADTQEASASRFAVPLWSEVIRALTEQS
jgi:hypothetical protein